MIPALIGLLLAAPGPELSPQEKEAGFVPMFNGKDLTGWEYLGKGKSPFAVRDGAIHYKGGNGWLCYAVKEYPDFELRCEFRLIKKGGDGGIFFRATKDAAGGAGWPSERYELQVKDYDEQGRLWGVKYKLDKEKVARVRKPLGEWETYRLVVQGNRVEVYLNGERVCTSDMARPLHHGYIGLQAEGGEEAFRNLRVRPLPAK
ncbi:MAG TPA: DUF1080 domain-containing protein [Gemmataceae bacterium]|nr:DUF1080 domain-containing protein [Gemmataceae bacterium]